MRRPVLIGAILVSFAAHASSQQTTRVRMQQLDPGARVARDLRPGESHAYEVVLLPGQYASAAVEQLGVDVSVKLFQPDGRASIEIDRATGTRGRERVVWIAETAGRYRLEIGAVRHEAPAGRYEITLIERRSTADADADRIALQEAFASAARLVRENNKASLATAIQTLEQAVARAHAVGDGVDEAAALMKLGETSMTVGNLKAAVARDEQAVNLFEALGDRFSEALALLRTGEAHRFSGDFLEALRLYQRALSFMREIGDAEGTGEALADVGEAYFVLHDLQQALEYDYKALPLIRASGRKEDLATILSNIGVVFRNLGETERALESYREALPVARAARQTNLEATILDNIGVSYLNLGEPAKALASFNDALPLRRVLGNKRGEALSLDNIAAAYRDLNQPERTLEYAGESLRLLEAVGDRYKQAMVLRNLGVTNHNIGNLDAALEYNTRALALYEASGDRFEQSTTLRNIAAVKRDRLEFAEARADIEKAIDLSDFVRSHAGTEEKRATYSAMMTGHYDLYVDLLMQMHGADPGAHHDWEAFRMSERARARSLIELLSESYADIREGVDQALLTREHDLGAQLTAELDGLTKVLTAAHTDAQRAAAEKKVASLEDEYRRVQADIRTRSPRYAALTQPEALGAGDVQREVVDSDTILLEYRLGTPHSYLWTITPDHVSTHELPPRVDIESRARHLYELLTTRQGKKGLTAAQQRAREVAADQQFAVEAAALSRILIDPVATELGTKRLLIVADGTLQFLPFSALPAPGGEAPLIATHEIVSAPSASVLAVMQRELAGRAPAARSVAVLADPVFSRDDGRVKLATAQRTAGGSIGGVSPLERAVRSVGEATGTLRRLLSSRDEAEAILAGVPDTLVLKALDFQANRSLAMSADLGQYRIVHFATHGLFESAHPDLSGLALSLVDESGRPQDGFLRLHEIYNLKLNADLVVLSACQTALGREVRGEGLIGLTRGFMYAGARRVVASLWQVDDAASANLMKLFYQGMLQSHVSPAAALRAAQLAVLTRKQWQSPYYWSAFTLQGDWRP